MTIGSGKKTLKYLLNSFWTMYIHLNGFERDLNGITGKKYLQNVAFCMPFKIQAALYESSCFKIILYQEKA